MAVALRNEDVTHLCTMKATSYHDDGHTVIFGTDNDAMGMGFEKIKLNFEKRMKGEGCKAIAFIHANAAEPDLSKDGLDWPCWILTVSTVKKCYKLSSLCQACPGERFIVVSRKIPRHVELKYGEGEARCRKIMNW
jgi:hypothetical protein